MVIRGSTDNLMDDIERAIDDGVNTFKVLARVSQDIKPRVDLFQLYVLNVKMKYLIQPV